VAITRVRLDQKIQSLPNYKEIKTRKELDILASQIGEEEQLFAVEDAFLDKKYWLFCVTSSRLVFVRKKFLGGPVYSGIQIHTIDAVTYSKGFLSAEIALQTGNETRKISIFPMKVDKFADAINKAVKDARRSSSPTPNKNYEASENAASSQAPTPTGPKKEPTAEVSAKSSKSLKFFVVLGVIVAAVWFFFFRGDSSQTPETSMPEEQVASVTAQDNVVDLPQESSIDLVQTKPDEQEIERQRIEAEAKKSEEEKEKAEEKRKELEAFVQKENTVVITPTGSKYHKLRCRTVRGSYQEMNVRQAIERGYERCDVCSPPVREWTVEDFDFPVYGK
jgi:hypothetical protein